jgi:hypothetical protein
MKVVFENNLGKTGQAKAMEFKVHESCLVYVVSRGSGFSIVDLPQVGDTIVSIGKYMLTEYSGEQREEVSLVSGKEFRLAAPVVDDIAYDALPADDENKRIYLPTAIVEIVE